MSHRSSNRQGKLFRRVNKVGGTRGSGTTVKAAWHIVKESAKRIGVGKLVPHDLRRTCARLCHASGGELSRSNFSWGHVSVQTTERCLGCKQRISSIIVSAADGLDQSGKRAHLPFRLCQQKLIHRS